MEGHISIKVSDMRLELRRILAHVREVEERFAEQLKLVHPENIPRARNFIHYLALRTFDLRALQQQLSELGISSMAHAEGYTLFNLQRINHLLSLIDNERDAFLEFTQSGEAPFTFTSYQQAFKTHSDRLFGEPSAGANKTHLMVTLPTEAAHDAHLVRNLLVAGMDVARINTSHDSPELWSRMVRHIRNAEVETGHSCKVYMDLSGPKLRTDLSQARVFTKNRWRKKKSRLRLYQNDHVFLAKHPDHHPRFTGDEAPVAIIGCSQPRLFEDVHPGQRIFFDDGKLGGEIRTVLPEGVLVHIQQASIKGNNLGGEKGINLPDTDLQLRSLTEDDYRHLPLVAEIADAVGYSFVRRPGDVAELQHELKTLGRPDLGIVLKIETREAFHHFPDLIFQAFQSPVVGIMIARGDLAVEIGFERIAEVQEELLWLAEAAHVPDIWATQVLENLAKKGLATRSEITDAAMATRAACVMLNKGPYITDAVRTLRDITSRMEQHINRKQGSLRPLRVAGRFV